MADSRQLSVRGGQIQAQVFEAGKGDAVLYLHGFRGLSGFEPWLEHLAERYRVLAPQHPGFGDSTGIEAIDDLQDLAIYYLDFLDTLGVAGAHLIGLDFGGMLAAEIAALDRSYVNKLVLCGSYGFWRDDLPLPDIFATPPAQLNALLWHDPEGPVAQANTIRPAELSPEAQMKATLDRVKAMSTTGKFIWPIPDRRLWKRIHRINAPTLLIWGESDHIVPVAYAELFRQRIPGARLVTIPEAGHLPMLEQPEQFLEAVTGFLG